VLDGAGEELSFDGRERRSRQLAATIWWTRSSSTGPSGWN
jgi:hypothetical protein